MKLEPLNSERLRLAKAERCLMEVRALASSGLRIGESGFEFTGNSKLMPDWDAVRILTRILKRIRRTMGRKHIA